MNTTGAIALIICTAAFAFVAAGAGAIFADWQIEQIVQEVSK